MLSGRNLWRFYAVLAIACAVWFNGCGDEEEKGGGGGRGR